MPWRMPAANTVSPLGTLNERPLGCTVTEKVEVVASLAVIFWVSLGLVFISASDFALKPNPSWRLARAISA
jgi:hypothetical protein